jgi:hypothetical protein
MVVLLCRLEAFSVSKFSLTIEVLQDPIDAGID